VTVVYVLSRFRGVTDGNGLDVGFIDLLYTPLGTIRNYSATANLHALQITTASAKLYQPTASSTAVPYQRLLTVEIPQFPPSRH
jgi:hypothetical protein